MDRTVWIVISAAVAIALAGIVLSISGEEISSMLDDQDDTVDDYGCGFEKDQYDCGDPGVSDRCRNIVCEINGG